LIASTPETPTSESTAAFRPSSFRISCPIACSSFRTREESALASTEMERDAMAKSRDRFDTVAICELGMM
jgi:hypothetical protein